MLESYLLLFELNHSFFVFLDIGLNLFDLVLVFILEIKDILLTIFKDMLERFKLLLLFFELTLFELQVCKVLGVYLLVQLELLFDLLDLILLFLDKSSEFGFEVLDLDLLV